MVAVARVAAAGLLAGLGVAVFAGPATAAGSTFTVANVNAAGAGSLNKAIADANAHAGADVIVFAASTNGHPLTVSETIAGDVAVKGNGRGVTIISGTLDVNTDGASQKVTATFSDLSVTSFDFNSDEHSSSTATASNVNVGSVDVNSDFSSTSAGTFNSVNVSDSVDVNSDNSSKSTGSFTGGSIQGAIDLNSDFSSTSTGTFSGMTISGGTDVNSDNSSTTNGSFTNVRVTGRGVDANSDSSTTKVSVTNSTFTGTQQEPLTVNDPGTTATVFGSTFANNSDSLDAVLGAQLHITNSTITGNAEGGVRSNGIVTLQNVTIAKNRGPAVTALSGSMSFGDSILGPNTLGSGDTSQECISNTQSFVSHGGNVSDDASCHPIAGDHPHAASNLGALGSNGGATQTMLPLAGSAAIDGGVAAGCPSTDQRGARRPQDANGDGKAVCDSGAVELAAATGSATPTTASPTTTAAPVSAAATPTTVTAPAELPRTGSSSAPLALIGAVVLAIGLALRYGSRRRRYDPRS